MRATRHLTVASGRAGCAGDISVGAIFTVCIVILLISLGFVGYAWYTTRSESARQREELREAQKRIDEAEIERRNAEAEQQKAENQAKLTLAKTQQETVLARTKALTTDLEAMLAEVDSLQAQLQALRLGEQGRGVAAHPDLVRQARNLFELEAPKLPPRQEVSQKLEAIRRVHYQVTDLANTAAIPSGEIRALVDDTRMWTDSTARGIRTVKGIADTLVREAQIKVAPEGEPVPASLQAAIDELIAFEAGRRNQVITEKTTVAEELAVATVTEAKTNAIVTEATIKAKTIEEEAAAKARAAALEREAREVEERAAALRAKARLPETQQLLAPFITPGNWNPKGQFTTTDLPMSYSGIQSYGALAPTLVGLQKLQEIARNKRDQKRPRMRDGRLKYNAELLEEYTRVQALLIELGPTLVEIGMLEP